MNSVVSTVETRVYDAISAAMDILVIPRLELAIMSAEASYTRNPSSIGLDPDDRGFSGNMENLLMKFQADLNQTQN